MTIQSPLFLSNIIELSFLTITFIFLILLVIYLIPRMQYNKCKLVWTPIDFVERRSNLSYEEFVREYASVGKPVIITDAMKNWKASTKWTVDFFRSEYGSVKDLMMDYKPENNTWNQTEVTMSIADYIDDITSDAGDKLLYLSDFNIWNYPKLLEDYEDPIYCNNWYKRIPIELLNKYLGNICNILIGRKDSTIGLHNDHRRDTAWVAVISGRKQVVLLSPDQEKYLYNGQVDCFNPDLQKFPLYANAKPVECILNQGEMLYIPSDWWHHVINLENTISLAINTLNEWDYEVVCQKILQSAPIKGHLFPLIVKFPFIGKALLAVGLV